MPLSLCMKIQLVNFSSSWVWSPNFTYDILILVVTIVDLIIINIKAQEIHIRIFSFKHLIYISTCWHQNCTVCTGVDIWIELSKNLKYIQVNQHNLMHAHQISMEINKLFPTELSSLCRTCTTSNYWYIAETVVYKNKSHKLNFNMVPNTDTVIWVSQKIISIFRWATSYLRNFV